MDYRGICFEEIYARDLGESLCNKLDFACRKVSVLLWGGYQRPMLELLSPMAVMLEGLGFNLCVVPFLNICVLNLPQRVGSRDVRGGWSWVRGVVLELDRGRLSWIVVRMKANED